MLYEHQGRSPRVHPSAVIASSAVISGDVELAEGVQVLHGAVITAEGGSVRIGASTIVMENAVVRGVFGNPVSIGDHCLVGPHAYVSGARIEPEVFLATGSRVFNGALVGRGSEIRIDAVVHLRTELPEGTVVPIGWIAVGMPLLIAPPDQHEAIWERQRELDFPEYVRPRRQHARSHGAAHRALRRPPRASRAGQSRLAARSVRLSASRALARRLSRSTRARGRCSRGRAARGS